MAKKAIKTSLARVIEKAYRQYGFVSAFLYGFQGEGKTTYALLTLYSLYGDWDKVKEYFFMDVRELEEFLEEKNKKRERLKAVVLDDAGVPLSKYEWRKEYAQRFSKVFLLARTLTGGFIFTSVSVDDIIKGIRGKIMYRINVRKLNERFAEANGYELYILPTLEEGVRWSFRDVYPLKAIPPSIRKWHDDMRREIIERLLSKREKASIDKEEMLKKVIEDIESL